MSFSIDVVNDIISGFKVIPTKKERNPVTTKKKAESPALKANGSPLPKSKSRVARETNPMSLHTSFNFGGRTNSSAASSMTRKSLIMEKMGDKDIVRQTFKPQICSNGSSSVETSNTSKRAPLPHRKGNER